MLAMFFWAFVVGGLFCVIGQLLFDVAKLTPGHTLSLMVAFGAILRWFWTVRTISGLCWSGCNGSDYQLWKFTCSRSASRSRAAWNSRCANRNV